MIDHVLFMVDGKNPSPVDLHFHIGLVPRAKLRFISTYACLNCSNFVRHPKGIERYKFLFRGLAATQLETDLLQGRGSYREFLCVSLPGSRIKGESS